MPPPDEPSLRTQQTTWRRISDFDLILGRTWCKIPVVPENSKWPFEVAKWLCDDERLQQRLANGLTASHGYLLGPDQHAFAAVWVPARDEGNVEGMLHVDLIDPGLDAQLDIADVRTTFEQAPRPQLEVHDQRIDEVTLPAGPALRVRERTSRLSHGRFSSKIQMFENVIYAVSPDGSSQGLYFHFSSDALYLGDAMAEDADAALPTLHVSLADSDAVT